MLGDGQGAAPCFTAVHVGAGNHSVSKESGYRQAMREACRAAAGVGTPPLAAAHPAGRSAAVCSALRFLEDHPFTNAGNGSNLTIDGCVECDASVMLGDGRWGAVGAAPGITNPSMAAALLAEESHLPLSLGRVRPTLLVGPGAWRFGLSRGLTGAGDEAGCRTLHVTPAAQASWRRYRQMILRDSEAKVQQQAGEGGEAAAGDDPLLPGAETHDTVGAIHVAADGSVSAGVSSGGIAMKLSGRVGEAAAFGAGCWAQDCGAGRAEYGPGDGGGTPGVAVSVSGVGERVVAALTARSCAEALASRPDDPADDVVRQVLAATLLRQPGPWDAGVIAARVTKCCCDRALSAAGNNYEHSTEAELDVGLGLSRDRVSVEFAACFTSHSLGAAYYAPSRMSSRQGPVAQVLRQQGAGGINDAKLGRRALGAPSSQSLGCSRLSSAAAATAAFGTLGYSVSWVVPTAAQHTHGR